MPQGIFPVKTIVQRQREREKKEQLKRQKKYVFLFFLQKSDVCFVKTSKVAHDPELTTFLEDVGAGP